jgi:hypothetical protein
VSERTAIFVQFDRTNPSEARALRYVGISVKGTFCSESHPDGANGAFTHFHRLTAPRYADGHGGPPGTEGYWLMWVATEEFESGGRAVKLGVDYQFSPTRPPACGSAPSPTFTGPGAHRITRGDIRELAAAFADNPLRGGQTAPRLYRWVTADTLVFLQFDKANPAKARALRYIGIAKRGRFCQSDQGHADFTHFQRLSAPSYAKGRGGKAGTVGFWHLAVAVGDFRMPGRGRVTAGVDRRFERTAAAPDCPKA